MPPHPTSDRGSSRAARNVIVLCVAGVATIFCAIAVAAQPAVTAVDLGTLGGTYSEALAVNDLGQVVGASYTAGVPLLHAFLWTAHDGMIDLGTLGGRYSGATWVNNGGQVVGESTVASDGSFHAFLWTASEGMIDLGTLGGPVSAAQAVNESGQVVGPWHAGRSIQ